MTNSHPNPRDLRPQGRTRAEIDETWRRLDGILSSIPAGSWTTYGDVARALDHYPQPVSGRISTMRPGAYWRVIRADGTVSADFTWADGRRDAERPVLDALRREGVRVEAGRADPGDRMTVGELRALTAPDAAGTRGTR